MLFKEKVLGHKKLLIAGFLIILLAGYFVYKNKAGSVVQVSYAVSKVEKGAIINTVSGTGQVSTLKKLEVKPTVSGSVVTVNIKEGQQVKSGDILIQIDARDALKAVRDAEANLESSQISLKKILQPADELSLLQAKDNLIRAKQTLQDTIDDLDKAYTDGFNTVSNAFLDLPTVMSGLNDILFGTSLSQSLNYNSQWNLDVYTNAILKYDEKASNYRNDAYNAYQKARSEYDDAFANYKLASRFSNTSTIESLVNQTYDTVTIVAEAVKNATNFIQFYKDRLSAQGLTPVSTASTHLTSLSNYTADTNSNLNSLLTIKTNIKTDKNGIDSAYRDINQKEASLKELEAGTDPLDIESQKLSIRQKENSLLDVRQNLANYTVRAPFPGQITGVTLQKGDQVSGSTVVGTLITEQKIAEITLNEVDIAKIRIGQKATLSFDAVSDISIVGEVSQIDAIGTVSQGVVYYNVQIIFQTADEKIKSGMSVSASIVTDTIQDVLVVPSSAIKILGTEKYVQILNPADLTPVNDSNSQMYSKVLPTQQIVTVGLSSDTLTEITSGIKEGDTIVSQTINSTSKTTTQQNSGIRIPGVTGGGGGFSR